jgi:hypothetical protein
MSQTGYTPIQIYYSTTAAAAPTAGNLSSGELAINITDGKLFYKDNAGAVQTLATKASAISSVNNNGVVYVNSSGQSTTGTALTFDGTLLTNAQSSASSGLILNLQNTTTGSYMQFAMPGVANVRFGAPNADAFVWQTFGSGAYPEQMRLTSKALMVGYTSDAGFSGSYNLGVSGSVGIGTSSPSASAILDAQSTTKGVRFPNMTTTQKNAISSPAAGLVVFDTTLAKLCVYSGSAWQTVTSI